jgi:hypothetical protein
MAPQTNGFTSRCSSHTVFSSCWSVKHTQTPPFAILAFTLHRIPPLNVPSSPYLSHSETHAHLQLPRDLQPATAAAVAAPPSCHSPSHPHQRQARNALLGQLVLANHTWRLPCLQKVTTTDPQKTKLKKRQRKRSVRSGKPTDLEKGYAEQDNAPGFESPNNKVDSPERAGDRARPCHDQSEQLL